jgi:hypothetical protein
MEIYYPTIDQPKMRGFQRLITDDETFCNKEKPDQRFRPQQCGVDCGQHKQHGVLAVVAVLSGSDPRRSIKKRLRTSGDAVARLGAGRFPASIFL